MYNKRTSTQRTYGRPVGGKRFGHSNGGGRFRAGSSRFATRRNKVRSPKFDIVALINKTVYSPVPEEIFVPEHSFMDFKLNPTLSRSIKDQGYTQPTPIQDKIIPSILQGKDVVGLANTGTGKTAAFLIPLIEKILQNPREQVLVVTPTRELASQIEQELRSLSRGMRIYSVVCVGGEYMRTQIRQLRYKNNFIVGTPGRLIDLTKRGSLILKEVHAVVLDEADRMLDMGFVNDIRFLMSHVSEERQTLCFSATMSKTIEALINDFLKNPSMISVKTSVMPSNIEQDVVRVNSSEKAEVLYGLLKDHDFKKVLVFGRTRRGVENLSRTLTRRGVRTESIHGDKTQPQRQRALLNFKQNRAQVLVATDVAARGLHISDVTHVINYEMPETYDDYIHRIGRTGRGAKIGKALTFVS